MVLMLLIDEVYFHSTYNTEQDAIMAKHVGK
jgi:hypothetical protein